MFKKFNLNKEKRTKYEQVHIAISYLIRISLVLAIVLSIIAHDWFNMFISTLALFLIYLPKVFMKKFNIVLPLEFKTLIVLFIYASIFLGEVRGFFLKFWWWDILLHGFSGLAIGFAGFLILYTLYKSGKFKASPIWIVIFSFCFALAIGTLWEFFEFGMDVFFKTNMQKPMLWDESGLVDTMFDLILDAIGAFIASVAGYFYIKKGDTPLLHRLISSFEKQNPHLFKKNR